MIFVQFYRFLRNYVTISISGGFGERFLNLCNKEKIYLWDTSCADACITTNIYCKDFIKIRKLRKKSGVKIKIIKKTGISFLIKKHRARKVLAFGLTAAAVACLILNQFVWSIEVIGSEKISDYEIIEAVTKLGLMYGTYSKGFDEKNAGRQAVNLFNGEILWMAINIKGSKATIEVRDYEKENKETAEKSPCNIIADFDGQIVNSEVFSGTEVSGRGSAVKKGELLISGITENTDGSVNYVSADGKISALHDIAVEKSYGAEYICSEAEEIKAFNRVDFFGISVPFFGKTEENNLSYSKRYLFDGKPLPLSFQKNVSASVTSGHTLQNDILYCIDSFSCEEYDKYRNTLIISSEYKISSDEKGYNIYACYNCLDFIGQKAYISVEN